MALIEVFHIVASELNIDATSSTDIPQGRIVTLDANGLVTTMGTGNTDPLPLGLAGDSLSNGVTSYTPESGSALGFHVDGSDTSPTTAGDGYLKGSLVLGAWGDSQRYTQNRVADNYNEVLSSGKMTVYHSGGEFWTDQHLNSDGGSAVTYTPGHRVYSSSNSSGRVTSDSTNSNCEIGRVLTSETEYPSGVPGTTTDFLNLNEGGNSMTYGEMLHIKLTI